MQDAEVPSTREYASILIAYFISGKVVKDGTKLF